MKIYICPICGNDTLLVIKPYRGMVKWCGSCGKEVIPLATPQEEQ